MGRRNRRGTAARRIRFRIPKRGRVRECGKRGYVDPLEAKRAIGLANNQHREHGLPLEARWYECPRCNLYHLTSQEQRSNPT